MYQICKAFRNEESGRLHNPEFTILEWYRVGFDHHQLMDEMDDFLQCILNVPKAQRVSYQQIFLNYLQINPHEASIDDLQRCAAQQNLLVESACLNRDDWLQLLMLHCIEPHLGHQAPVFIYDFPASQAALSKIRQDAIPVAERFEVYIQGLEIANGYHELCHAAEQQERFRNDHLKRQTLNYTEIPLDVALIAALEHGMPDCAGVALGVDRLVMLALQRNHIADVVAFPIEVA
jgi:elongation factor P--(R)-beta-lysine ligase